MMKNFFFFFFFFVCVCVCVWLSLFSAKFLCWRGPAVGAPRRADRCAPRPSPAPPEGRGGRHDEGEHPAPPGAPRPTRPGRGQRGLGEDRRIRAAASERAAAGSF